MSNFSLRRNNLGRAILRFLIGLFILAIIVWLLYEFVLNGNFDLSGTKVDNAIPLATEYVPAALPTQESSVSTGDLPVIQATATSTPTPTPTLRTL